MERPDDRMPPTEEAAKGTCRRAEAPDAAPPSSSMRSEEIRKIPIISLAWYKES
jgi:hypothetical protein